jgi:rhodanese-related sulfurtransferase
VDSPWRISTSWCINRNLEQDKQHILEWQFALGLAAEREIVTFLIDNWYWVVLALGSAALLLFPELAGDVSNKGVDLNEAVRRLNREKAMLVDVRDSAEFAKVHIAQARSIPLSELEEKLPTAIKNKNICVLFICKSGVLSMKAAKRAQKLGYANAHSVAGGMDAWKKANMPVMAALEKDAVA